MLAAYPGASDTGASEISLQPSPEQEVIIVARHVDPGGSIPGPSERIIT
jgi:hypothetical protein